MCVTSSLLLAVACLASAAHAGWPLCKQQCDTNFTEDQIVEHPGVKSICHRGCELFTVALISSPRGGLPLVPDFSSLPRGPMNIKLEPKLKTLLGSENEMKQNEKHAVSKVDKEKQELNEKITRDIENDAKPHDDSGRMKRIMDKIKAEKLEVRKKAAKITEEKENEQAKKESVTKSDKKETKTTDKKVTDVKIPTPPKSQQRHVFTKPFRASKSNVPLVTKIPSQHVATVRGEKAREILEEARNSEKRAEIAASSSVPHGPVPLSAVAKKTDSHKHAEDDKKPKNTATPQLTDKKLTHSSVSKTTVQPVPHPVQDHPVHASRQITTDSSDADERKPTTPQSSNPVLSPDHKVPEFITFSKLANKLGSSGKNKIHPILSLSFGEIKPMGIIHAPKQISIIEIVNKKHNMDFDKLHQEHMKDAVHCPKILERFEQAKQACRHACSTAYSVATEKEACLTGCLIQVSSSISQVKAQAPKPFGHKSGMMMFGSPDSFFSNIRNMFSNMVAQIGQSFHSLWSSTSLPLKEPHQENGSSKLEPEPVEVKLPGLPPSKPMPHMEVEVVVESHGPRTVQHKTIVGPRGRVINTETVVEIVGHQQPMTPEELFSGQPMNHKNIIQQEIQMQGKLLAEAPKDIEQALNHQLEIMGQHLNEDGKKMGGGVPSFFPSIFADLMSPKIHDQAKESEKKKDDSFDKMIEKETSFLHKLFPLPPLFREPFRSSKKNSEVHVENPTHEMNNLKEVTLDQETGKLMIDRVGLKQGDMPSTIHVFSQPQDLLDCISRKSGLPRWLIVLSLYSSVLVVFWLAYLMYAYLNEKMRTIVMNEYQTVPQHETSAALTFGVEEDNCYCEKEKLLDDVIKVRVQKA